MRRAVTLLSDEIRAQFDCDLVQLSGVVVEPTRYSSDRVRDARLPEPVLVSACGAARMGESVPGKRPVPGSPVCPMGANSALCGIVED